MISTAMKAKTAMDCGCFGNIYLVSVITKPSLCFLAAFPMHPGRQTFDEALVKRWLERIIVWEDHFTVELKSRLKIDIEG